MEFSIFLILITLVSFFLVVIIMVQNPKGGGLSSSLGGSQVVGGVQNTNNFLDKGTWTLAIILVALILLSTLSFSNGSIAEDKYIDESAVQTEATTDTPAADAAVTPAEGDATSTEEAAE